MKRRMSTNVKVKCAAIVGTAALLGGTAFLASGSTGAYFSDTHTGAISGTIGTIRVTPSGGSPSADGSYMDLAFNNLLPGDPQALTVNYQNTGNSPEDVYVVFPNVTALSALNSLGRYGTVHLFSSGFGALGDVFDSQNLNDNTSSCPPGSTVGGNPPCAALPEQVLIASNVTPGSSGVFSFSFMYASALKQGLPGPAASWNTYPVNGQTFSNQGESGSGLPYEIVATQVGITPGAVGTLP